MDTYFFLPPLALPRSVINIIQGLYFLSLGDNLLTAISVARECRMVDAADQIILVEAAVAKDNKPALNFVYADDKTKPVEEVKGGGSGSLIQIEELDQVFHFAVEGKSWSVLQQHYPEILDKVNITWTGISLMVIEVYCHYHCIGLIKEFMFVCEF